VSIRERDAVPVVVRCLSCRAAVDRSVAGECPFCGTDVASMPLIEPEPPEPEPEPVLPEPVVVAPVQAELDFEEPAPSRAVRGPGRGRSFAATAGLLFAAALLGALGVSDASPQTVHETPLSLPSVAIPLVTGQPAASARRSRSPSPTPRPSVAEAAGQPEGCDFFTTRELDREYAFERSRADLKLARANENNEHRFRIDHDAAARKTRAEDAAGDHSVAIASLDRRMGAARASCDPTRLF
jgi:hypothetical protein